MTTDSTDNKRASTEINTEKCTCSTNSIPFYKILIIIGAILIAVFASHKLLIDSGREFGPAAENEHENHNSNTDNLGDVFQDIRDNLSNLKSAVDKIDEKLGKHIAEDQLMSAIQTVKEALEELSKCCETCE